MLKRHVDSLDGIDEKHRGVYEEDPDGGFRLIEIESSGTGTGGDSDEMRKLRGKVDEFRTNNNGLKSDLEKARARAQAFEGIDPEVAKQAHKLMEDAAEEEERKLLAAGDINGLVQRRTSRMALAHEKELGARDDAAGNLKQENDGLRNQLAVFTIDTAVTSAIEKIAKPKPGARADILARARRTWRVDKEGKTVPDATGSMEFGEDGKAQTFAGYAKTLIADAPHLFEAGKGGNAGDGDDRTTPSPGGRLDADDPMVFGRNLDDIADGKVQVKL